MRQVVTYRHGSDGRFWKEPLVFLELSISFVGFGRVFIDRQISFPAADDVSVEMCVFQVAAFESVDLPLQVGKSILETATEKQKK